MDEITDISIGCETDEGIVVSIEGLETVELSNGDEIEQTSHLSTCLSREELQSIVDESTSVLNRDKLNVNGKTKITELCHSDGTKTELFIEPYEFPDDAEPTKHWGVLTDSYELGAMTSGETEIQQDLTHSIGDVEGTAFRLISDSVVDVAYTCLLTDWKRDENGEVEDIEIPDNPYDQGHFDLEPGDYRVWEERNPDLLDK